MADLLLQLQYGIVTFLAVLVLIALTNCLALRRLSRYAHGAAWPRVSILLPARDEADNIAACVRSLLAQDYPAFELLVLDDASTDGTSEILRALAWQHSRLQVVLGRRLPQGWLGKHWACHQLAQIAAGELWLLTDADTRHHPQALRNAVAALYAERADLISALPHQVMGTWGERLIVSLLPWSLLCFYPFALAERLTWPGLATAVGQFMLIRREAYAAIGGHAAVRAHAADDIALARRLVARGGRWRLLDGQARIACRMYRSFGQAQQGFSRTMLAAFGYRVLPFAAIWLWLGIVFVAPWFLAASALVGGGPSLGLSLWAIGLALALWVLCAWRLRLPASVVVLYPVVVSLAVCVALQSIALVVTGRATWKGRVMAAPR